MADEMDVDMGGDILELDDGDLDLAWLAVQLDQMRDTGDTGVDDLADTDMDGADDVPFDDIALLPPDVAPRGVELVHVDGVPLDDILAEIDAAELQGIGAHAGGPRPC